MCWILSALFVIICFINYYREKKLTIALVSSLEWAFLSLMVCILDLPRDEMAFFFVLINTALFSLSHQLFPARLGDRVRTVDEQWIEQKYVKYDNINKIVVVLNLLSVIYLAYTLGFSIFSFGNLNSLMMKMNAIARARYSEDANYLPVINRLVNSIVYATCGYNGFFMARKWKTIHLVNMFLLLFQTVLTNTKATMVFGIAFFAGGYLTGFHYFDKKLTKKKVLGLIGLVFGLILFSAVIDYLRHKGDSQFAEEIKGIIVRYFIGPYSAFSLWFVNGEKSFLDFGSNTFACVFRLLGIREQIHGDVVTINGLTTNVYTIFKHLINDYSYVGTFIISGVVGLISTIVDRSLGTKKFSSVGCSIAINATILVAFFSSMFRYTTNLLAALIIIGVSLPLRFSVRRR